MVFLGGSQAIDNGAYRTKNSDFDLLVIGAHIEKPVSLTLHDAKTERHFDIILRDLDTLAYDIQIALEGGKGTLLHLAAHGRPLLDKGRAAQVQETLLRIHGKGPYPVEAASLKDRCSSLSAEIDVLARARSPHAHTIASVILAHELGTAALRASRHWVGKGKILGRFLLAALPEFKQELERSYAESTQGDSGRLKALAQTLPALREKTGDSFPVVPFYPGRDLPEVPADTDEAFHAARMDERLLFKFFHADEEYIRNGALEWLRFKYELTAKAVDPERLGRASNEYFYAVARYLRHLMLETMLASRVEPYSIPIIGQAEIMLRKDTALNAHVEKALRGRPQDLLRCGKEHHQRLASPQPGFLPRTSAASNRMNAAVLGF
jgi:hypothetical protein